MTGRARTFVDVRDVAFGDVDWARVLYYPRYLHYCHLALESFVGEALSMSYADLLEIRGLGFPTVRVEAEYARPIKYGSRLETEVTVVRVGGASLVLRFDSRIGGELHASATITKCLVDMTTFEPCRIPDWIRDGFAEYGGG